MKIKISYPETLKNRDVFIELDNVFSKSQYDIEIVRTPTEAYASVDWIIPAVITAYITKPFFEAFFSEAGKDTYKFIKKEIIKIVPKIKQTIFSYKLSRKQIDIQNYPSDKVEQKKAEQDIEFFEKEGLKINRDNKQTERTLDIQIEGEYSIFSFIFLPEIEIIDYENIIDKIPEFINSLQFKNFYNTTNELHKKLDRKEMSHEERLYLYNSGILRTKYYFVFNLSSNVWELRNPENEEKVDLN